MNGNSSSSAYSSDRAIPDVSASRLWEQTASRLEPELWTSLTKMGFRSPLLYDGLSDLTLAELVDELRLLLARPLQVGEVLAFKLLIDASFQHAGRKRRFICNALVRPGLCQQVPVVTKPSIREEALANCQQPALGDYPHSKGKKPLDKDAQRRRAVEAIVLVIQQCAMPAAALLTSSIAPSSLAARMGAGKRVSTLLGKLREYRRMRKFLQLAFGVCWPTALIQLVDYIMDLADIPVGPTVPGAVLSMIAFFENVGAVAGDKRFSGDPVVKCLTDDLTLELRSANPRVKRKANLILLAFVASWELFVTDLSYSEVARLEVWKRLVKLWASLRSADSSGVPEDSLVFEDGVLSGRIDASKTTGAGKSVGALFFFVSNKAWILVDNWLEKGWILFKFHRASRTFMNPLPCKDRLAYSQIEASYEQCSTASRRMLAETNTFSWEDLEDGFQGWQIDHTRLLLPLMAFFWSLHSERGTVNTWAALLQVEKSRRDPLGRWRPSESDDYTRNSRIIVCEVQELVAASIRNANGKDLFGEELVLKELESFSLKRGAEPAAVTTALESLRRCRNLCSELGDAHLLSDLVEADVEFVEEIDQDLDEPAGGWPVLSKGARVVSTIKGGTVRTLHIVGKCYRVPGVHYTFFNLLDETERGEYSFVCKECFPPVSESEQSDSSSESSDSSGDSSS